MIVSYRLINSILLTADLSQVLANPARFSYSDAIDPIWSTPAAVEQASQSQPALQGDLDE